MDFTLPRTGDRDLSFQGDLLATSSSRRGNARRWLELSLYRTTAGSYVVYGVGRTQVPDEVDRTWAVIADSPGDAIHALERDELRCADCGNAFLNGRRCKECGSADRERTGVRYLTRTANDVIKVAAERDSGIREAFVETVV